MAQRLDHRVRVTKQMLRKALLEMMREEPFEKITVIALCQRAGVNRGTFYTHYPDIGALLKEIEDELVEGFSKALDGYRSADQMMTDIQRVFSFIWENEDICCVLLGGNSDKEMIWRVVKMSKEKFTRLFLLNHPGTPRGALDDYFTFVAAGCLGLLREWVVQGMRRSIDEITEALQTLIRCASGFILK